VIAAIKHGRIGYGCDNVPEYVNIAWKRVGAFRAGTLKTRPPGRPIYDPAKPHGGQRDARPEVLELGLFPTQHRSQRHD
jgi:adenine-specific DNA-methyltransferase